MYYLLNNRFWTKILTDNNDLQHFKVNTEGKNIEKTRSFSLMHRPMQKITRCSQREHAHIRRPYLIRYTNFCNRSHWESLQEKCL